MPANGCYGLIPADPPTHTNDGYPLQLCRVDARRAIHQRGVGAGLRVAMEEPRRVPPYMITLFLKRHQVFGNYTRSILPARVFRTISCRNRGKPRQDFSAVP